MVLNVEHLFDLNLFNYGLNHNVKICVSSLFKWFKIQTLTFWI